MLAQVVPGDALQGLLSFTVLVLVGLAIMQMFNFVRYVKARDWNGAVQIALSFGVGYLVAFWMAHAAITTHLVLIQGAPEVGLLDVGSLLFLGVGIGSVAPSIVDFFKSRDNMQTVAKPPLVKPSGDYADDGTVEGLGE